MSRFHYRPGLLEGMPEDITSHIMKYDEMFRLGRDDMVKITDHFVKELEKGLSKEGGNIVSNS